MNPSKKHPGCGGKLFTLSFPITKKNVVEIHCDRCKRVKYIYKKSKWLTDLRTLKKHGVQIGASHV